MTGKTTGDTWVSETPLLAPSENTGPAPAIVTTESMAPTMADEMHSYISMRSGMTLRLRPPVRTNINGKEYRKAGLRVQFTGGQYATKNLEIIGCLDEMLTGESGKRWQRLFYKVPSKKVISKIAKAQEVARDAEKKQLEKTLGEDESKEMDNWRSFLAKAKKPRVTEAAEKTMKERGG